MWILLAWAKVLKHTKFDIRSKCVPVAKTNPIPVVCVSIAIFDMRSIAIDTLPNKLAMR